MEAEEQRFSTAPSSIPINDLRVFDEGDDTHLASAGRTNKRVYLINFADHLGPASGRDMILPFNDRRMEAGDMVEGAIWGCASLGYQDMDVGMTCEAFNYVK